MVNVNDWVLISRRFFHSSKYPFFKNISDHAMLYSVKQWPSMVLLWWSFSRPNWRTQHNHFALNQCGAGYWLCGICKSGLQCSTSPMLSVLIFDNNFWKHLLFYSASHQLLMFWGIETTLCRHCLLVSRCLN
jgi:hypothetical protein